MYIHWLGANARVVGMTLYVGNAFSLNMLGQDEVCVYVGKISVERARRIIQKVGKIVSVVGHQVTADALSTLLGVKIEVNRAEIKLDIDDILIVFQLRKRLAEGQVLKSIEEIKQVGYDLYVVVPKRCPATAL
jgi:hypothetical protein